MRAAAVSGPFKHPHSCAAWCLSGPPCQGYALQVSPSPATNGATLRVLVAPFMGLARRGQRRGSKVRPRPAYVPFQAQHYRGTGLRVPPTPTRSEAICPK